MQIHVSLFVFERDVAILLQENLVVHPILTKKVQTVYRQALNCELPVIPVENFRHQPLLSLRWGLHPEINQKVTAVHFTRPCHKFVQINFYFPFLVKKEGVTGFKRHIFWDQMKCLKSAWVINDPKVGKFDFSPHLGVQTEKHIDSKLLEANMCHIFRVNSNDSIVEWHATHRLCLVRQLGPIDLQIVNKLTTEEVVFAQRCVNFELRYGPKSLRSANRVVLYFGQLGFRYLHVLLIEAGVAKS